jgi:hypothetical protein
MARWMTLAASLLVLSGCMTGDVKWCGSSRFGSADARAIGILQSAERLESSHVGDWGVASCSVVAYRHIIRQPDAAATFKALVEKSGPAGRIYALAGLYEVDRAAFERLIAAAQEGSPATFERVSTCVVTAPSKQEVFALLRSGELSAWWRPRG